MDAGLKNTMRDIEAMKAKVGQLSMGFKELDLGYKSYVREKTDLEEMKKSLEKLPEIPRRRFDYVISNPPYVGYNEASKQKVLIIKFIQEKKAQMSNIYGVNLNTVPGRIKAYAPKPNLYAFFIALGIALLKDRGKLCYIIPQTILTASDLDVLRYYLAKFTTIEKIITFSGKMFIGRGLKQNKPIPTSSLIFVLNKKMPSSLHKVEVINYKNPNDNLEETLQNILTGKKIVRKKILQEKLYQNVANWSFIKQDKKTLEFFDYYKHNEAFDIYRIPEFSKSKFNSIFYFDKGLVFPKNKIIPKSELPDGNYFHIIKAKKNKYQLSLSGMVVLELDIRFPKGSQGIEVYEKKYKVIWRYMNANRFYFTDEKIMLNFNWVLISSDNKNEMLYIFSLLNSKLNRFVFNNLLKSENEKDILLGIKAIKEFARVPKINKGNQYIKDEIIKCAEDLLNLEGKILSNFVDFSNIMVQKFDRVLVKDCHLILKWNNEVTKLDIRENLNLIKKVIYEKYNKMDLISDKQSINLSELKDLPVIDYEKQNQIKEYIDDLIFALYFNIPIENFGLNKAIEIKSKLLNNKYYNFIKNVN